MRPYKIEFERDGLRYEYGYSTSGSALEAYEYFVAIGVTYAKMINNQTGACIKSTHTGPLDPEFPF